MGERSSKWLARDRTRFRFRFRWIELFLRVEESTKCIFDGNKPIKPPSLGLCPCLGLPLGLGLF